VFGTSGIRGTVGEDVTAGTALSVGRALAAEGYDRVVVGRDPRESGAMLRDALAAGLREGGSDVVDLGHAATPTIARSVEWQKADAGVSITASHNPAPDNGLKLWAPSGQAFDEARREAITARVESERYDFATWDRVGECETYERADREHHNALVDAVSIDDPPSVVVDVGNGAGGVTAGALRELGCNVETLNADPDGSFPARPSEPTAENCETLQTVVANSEAEVGIAHDGDADRMMAVTGEGEFVSGDVLLALFALQEASKGQRVAVPVDTSLLVADALDDVGASVTRTKVGDVYVAEEAVNEDVAFGGEPSGAWIWPDETLCPDGPLAACKLAALVSERGALAEQIEEIDTYPIKRANVEVPNAEKATRMERIAERVREEYDDVSAIDGVRVGFEDGWILVRASGTQPLIRLTAEARSEERAAELLETARGLVEE